MQDLYVSYGRRLTASSMQVVLGTVQGKELPAYTAELESILKADPVKEMIVDKVSSFVKASYLREVALDIRAHHNNNRIDEGVRAALEALKRANEVVFGDSGTTKFGDAEAFADRMAAQAAQAVPTGIWPIDVALGGGMKPQTWTTFIGASNAGKCLSADTLIHTELGLIPISDVRSLKPSRVVGIDGKKQILAFYENGTKPLYRITFECGLSIDSSLDHIHGIATSKGLEEIKTADLKPGMFGVLPAGTWLGDKPVPENIAWLLGFTLGDGSYSRCPRGLRNLNWTAEIGSPVYDKLRTTLSALGLAKPREHTRGRTKAVWGTSAIADQLEAYGLRAGTKQDKFILNIMSWDRSAAKAYIAGLLDADGTVSKRGQIVLTLNNYQVLKQLQQVFFRMGYFSNLRAYKKKVALKNKTINNYQVWSLFFSAASSLKARQELGLQDKWKDGRLYASAPRGGRQVVVTEEIRRALLSHGIGYFSGSKAQTVLSSTLDRLRIPYDDRYWPVKIVSIEPSGEGPTYDLSVDGDHLFVANGLLTHNSMLSSNFAYFAAMAGKKTLVTIHEDEEETKARFISRFSGVPTRKYLMGAQFWTKQERDAIMHADQVLSKHVELRFMSGEENTIENVKEFVRRHHAARGIDLYVCDYGQCLYSNRVKSIENSYKIQEIVYWELKQLCNELNIAGVGGAQSNREAAKKNRAGGVWLKPEDVSDSYSVVRKSSNIITLNRSEQAEQRDEVYFHLCKARGGVKGITVCCESDYSRAITHMADEVDEHGALLVQRQRIVDRGGLKKEDLPVQIGVGKSESEGDEGGTQE